MEPTVVPQGLTPYAGGIVRLVSAKQMDDESRKRAEASQNQPVVQSLAAYVQTCWAEAKSEKMNAVEDRMFKSLRQRRGEYEPDKLAAIRKQGGSEIYMMLTSVKCRAAASWLKDSLLGQGNNKPWTLNPTPVPELPEAAMQAIAMRVMMDVQQFLAVGGFPPNEQMIENAQRIAADRIRAEQLAAAKKAAELMEDKMEDQLIEGGFHGAMSKFINDIVTFPAAFLKGPVVRRKKKLTWVDGEPVAEDSLEYEWERVNPFDVYPSPGAEDVNDGYLFERHKLSRGDLTSLIGVEGYNDDAIRAVIEDYGKGGLREWLTSDVVQEDGVSVHSTTSSAATIDALQFWGNIPASMLVEWGMEPESFPDRAADYAAEVWLIGRWVIKAVLNADPLERRPYFKASYEEIPGEFWGNSVADLVRDTQNVCNAAARALVNNMGIASGPQVWFNVDRLPAGEQISQLFPWKVWQGTSDPLGSTAPPMGFFQPNSLSNELMAVYERFSILADEYSGVPRYMTGTEGTPGAGRTASGLSMMINNAGKTIKQVLAAIDVGVITPLLELLFYYNMRYSDDPDLKGDVCINAKGASNVVAKEAQLVRLNEFLNLTVGNQTVAQIVGPEGIAALLREGAKQLDLDIDKIVPSAEMIRANQLAQQNAQQQQQAMLMAMAQQPTEKIQLRRDGNGEVIGADVMAGPNGQALMNGAPVTDIFQPAA